MKDKKEVCSHKTISITTNIILLLFSFTVLSPGICASEVDQDNAEAVVVLPTVSDLINEEELSVNSLIRVLGYHATGDGGGAEYLIKEMNACNSSEDYCIKLSNGLTAILFAPREINYRMFGAKGDGVNNDAIQIAQAHAYANAKNLPVVNRNGEFWLNEAEMVTIQTDVDWGNTIFHIDEKYNSKRFPRFEITSKNAPQDIVLTKEKKRELLSSLNAGETIIPILEPYKNHLVVIADTDDRIGYRSGKRYKGQSWAKEELFYVEEAGRIIGDITWSFNDYTKLTAYPVDKNYLKVEGGVFYLSGENPSTERGYYKNGFLVKRSKTIISNQWVGLGPGKEDTTTLSPRSGFYTISNVYDFTLQNVRLIPYLLTRKNGERVHSGTYGISMGRVLKSHFNNVTADGSRDHWGVFGTNLNKDFHIEDCHLNRVDVHFHCWNLSIVNSHIGEGGISITGGGNLNIDNSSCAGSSFVNFRNDYGSRWEGDITITNSTFKVKRERSNMLILSFNPSDFDYKYPIRLGRNIRVKNFKIDFSEVEQKDATCWLMGTPRFSVMQHGDKIILPNHMDFENIEVIGREKGIRLMELSDQWGYMVDKPGGYDNKVLKTNAIINFQNIQLEDLSRDENGHHFVMHPPKGTGSEYAFYPSVSFSECTNIAIRQGGATANIFFDKCSISNISGSSKTPLRGRFVFWNCEFNPIVKNRDENVYLVYSAIGTFFTNCIVNAPVFSGEVRVDLFDKIGFVTRNDGVDFKHSNTLLNETMVELYKEEIAPRLLQTTKGNP